MGFLLFGCNTKVGVSNAAGPSPSPHSGVHTSETALGQVEMRLKADPERPIPEEDVHLVLTPFSKEKPGAQISLDVEHTKKVHLVVASNDLSWFEHVHPMELTDGTYRIARKFPSPGEYLLFADYKPKGGEQKVDRFSLKVGGDAPADRFYETESLESEAGDGFTAVLTPKDGPLLTGQPSRLKGKILKNGKEIDVNTLEDYLGEKAHMVIIGLADKDYLHVHPGIEGSLFDLHTTFEKPGVYRGWLQFQSAGEVYTSDFVFQIRQGETSTAPVTSPNPGKHDGH